MNLYDGAFTSGFTETEQGKSQPVTIAASATFDSDTIAITGHTDGSVRLWRLEEG